jgi:glutaminase
MSCRDLARAAAFLARHGLRADGSAGDFAYRVALPAKSGVGGGILAVVPTAAP